MRDTSREFGEGLLARAGIVVNGPEPWDIQIHDDRVWARVLRDRELGLGEAYQDGWWDAERVDELLTRVLVSRIQESVRPSRELLMLAAKSLVTNRQSTKRAKRNASAHYNIGNDLFEHMLDKRMIYSCGYWARANDLNEAQEHKLDLICQKLHLEPGMKVLDIGCGWGGFAQFAAERYEVHVTGISPASEQVAVARERCAGLDVKIIETDYRHLPGTFDRIVSIGMMEHVGARNYPAFFAACDRHLVRDGIMLHHTIGSLETKNRTDPWFDKYIFPGGVLPSIAQIGRSSEKRWVIEDLHNFGPDYDRTLMAWLDNIDRSWDELPAYDERFRRTWRYYLQASAAVFRTRNIQLWQLVFRRAVVPSPTYRAVR